MFDTLDLTALPEPEISPPQLARPIEYDPEYIALKAKVKKLTLDYYMVWYYNHTDDDIFT